MKKLISLITITILSAAMLFSAEITLPTGEKIRGSIIKKTADGTILEVRLVHKTDVSTPLGIFPATGKLVYYPCGVLESFKFNEPTAVQIGNGFKAAEKCERRTKKCRYFELGTDMEEKSTDTGEEKSHLNRKTFSMEITVDQDRNQYGGTKHGEHVLQTEDQHLGNSELTGIIDGALVHLWFVAHQKNLPFRLLFDLS